MMKSILYLSLGLLVLLVGTVYCRPEYQRMIPNVASVPHPCKPNYMWRGLGHQNPMGSGELNPFGLDFQRVREWSQLCPLDSDGDGLTNGQELGDPSCTWRTGEVPFRLVNITHPGVCDPWGSSKCAQLNSWVDCGTGKLECEATKESHVRKVTYRFPPTPVPAKDTTYMCYNFKLPSDQDYHIIASEPFINNSQVMHHIVVLGCDDKVNVSADPYECNMGASGCQTNLGLWTLGMNGECHYKDAGFRIGKSGYKYMVIQHHWTNIDHRTDFVDSSGMSLYITPQLRPFDAGVLLTGQVHLDIPPGLPRVERKGNCSSHCTRKAFKKPIKVFSSLGHMHYLGISDRVELLRGGRKIVDVIHDPHYSYDDPRVKLFNPPLDVYPGDELITTCHFQSLTRERTVAYGDGSYDEMCFGILSFYPADAMQERMCINHKELEFCDFKDGVLWGCNFGTIFNFSNPDTAALYDELVEGCSYSGSCKSECPATIAKIRQHPCFRHDGLSDYVHSILATISDVKALQFSTALRSCQCPEHAPNPEPEGGGNRDTDLGSTDGANAIVTYSAAVFMTTVLIVIKDQLI